MTRPPRISGNSVTSSRFRLSGCRVARPGRRLPFHRGRDEARFRERPGRARIHRYPSGQRPTGAPRPTATRAPQPGGAGDEIRVRFVHRTSSRPGRRRRQPPIRMAIRRWSSSKTTRAATASGLGMRRFQIRAGPGDRGGDRRRIPLAAAAAVTPRDPVGASARGVDSSPARRQ